MKVLTAAACIIGGSVCSATLAAPGDGSRYMSVEYADSLLGTQAMFAVRVCSGNEAASRLHGASLSADGPVTEAWRPGDVHSPPGGLPWIHETLTAIPAEILVRVFDVDGREISRHEGPLDVCGYARIAAAFVVDAGAAGAGETR